MTNMLPDDRLPRLDHYLPFELQQSPIGIRVVWAMVSAHEFREPFMFQTFQRLYNEATAKLFVETDLDSLLAIDELGGADLSGLIFHVSRCGSTLLSNTLRASGTTIALSEPPMPLSFLMQLLQHPSRYSLGAAVTILRATLVAIRRCCQTERNNVVIKMFSGNVLQLPLIRAAAPHTPEVFLYRDPLEVLMSNVSTPEQRWVWEEGLTGVCPRLAIEMPIAELFARAIGRMMTAMKTFVQPNTLLINYADLNQHTVKVVVDHLRLATTDDGLKEVQTILRYRAKQAHEGVPFVSDRAAKHTSASARLRSLAFEHCGEQYAALEAIRLRQT
jgi:hypothetical protein